jgi:mannose-6-phosphate isomerase-like protein (cupin superfamily)
MGEPDLSISINGETGLFQYQSNYLIRPRAHDYHEQIYFILKGTGIITVGMKKKE